MKILVLGAGVVGVTGAWYLAAAGHEVTVVERRREAGMETSFANGGQISAGHAEPWAQPAVLPKVLRWLGREEAPLLFRPRADIFEDEEGVTLVADMPGVDESSLEVTLDDNVLKIVGRTQDRTFDGHQLRYREFDLGDYERSFVLSDRVDAARISASIKNGQLRVSVPKAKPAQKRISVRAG